MFSIVSQNIFDRIVGEGERERERGSGGWYTSHCKISYAAQVLT